MLQIDPRFKSGSPAVRGCAIEVHAPVLFYPDVLCKNLAIGKRWHEFSTVAGGPAQTRCGGTDALQTLHFTAMQRHTASSIATARIVFRVTDVENTGLEHIPNQLEVGTILGIGHTKWSSQWVR